MDFETIHRQHKNIRRKIRRCKETGDLKRLVGLRNYLERIRKDIEKIKWDNEPPKFAFKKSSEYDVFVENVLKAGGESTSPASETGPII